jgi:hypothetical protein
MTSGRRGGPPQRGFAGRGGRDLVAEALHEPPDQRNIAGLVVNDEDSSGIRIARHVASLMFVVAMVSWPPSCLTSAG